MNDRASVAFDPAKLSDADWVFLNRDLAFLVAEVISSNYDSFTVAGYGPGWNAQLPRTPNCSGVETV